MLTQINDPVHLIRPCYIRKKKALFHRWIEMTFPKGSSFFHQTLAIVEFEDGHIEQVRPKSIVFADGGYFNDITWKELNDDGDGMEEVRNEMKNYEKYYEEPETDWSKVEVDTPILVRFNEDKEWERRYFAKYENGFVYAWSNGITSWTAFDNDDVTAWPYAKLEESNER